MRNRPTVVFDTNVLVAELAFPEEPARCVALAEAGVVTAATSPALLREFAAVLGYDRLPVATLAPERRALAVERAADCSRVVEPAVGIDAAADPDDDAVFECAVAAAAECVVSDDAHLRELDGLLGVAVVTREEFLARHASPDSHDPAPADRNDPAPADCNDSTPADCNDPTPADRNPEG